MFINTTNVVYNVPLISGANSYNWSVPVGATIVSGQNTNQINVNWGLQSSQGNVALNVVRSCGTTLLILPITLVDDNACEIILDDMNGNTNVSYDEWTTNTFLASRNNPNNSGINTSTKVGVILKTNLIGTNKFVIGNLPIADFGDYESGQRILYMDVNSTADPGTTVELRLQNKTKAHNGTYPAGVRSVLKAKTNFNRQWETLVFKLDRTEDLTTSKNEIDQIAVVFNAEENQSGISMYFDNIKRKKISYNIISGYETPSSCNLTNQVYSVSNNVAPYTWSVPAGTSLVSGQGTDIIHVNCGTVTLGKIYLTETVAGCTGYSSSIDIKATDCLTGILEDNGNFLALAIYPNPSKDQLTVFYDLPSPSDVKLIISSSWGETLLTKTYNGQSGTFNEQLSIQELKPGIYIVQLVTASDIRSSQLIKY